MIIEQNVGRLQVTVQEAMGVHIVQGFSNTLAYALYRFFRKFYILTGKSLGD